MKKIVSIATIATTFALATMSMAGVKQDMAQNKKMSKPFLILGKMPHLTKLVKQNWDTLKLSDEQKSRLLQIQKETLGEIKSLQPKITKLEEEVAKAAMNGAKPENLKAKVDEIAKLKAKATMVHIKCIYNTRKVLTPKQLAKLIRK